MNVLKTKSFINTIFVIVLLFCFGFIFWYIRQVNFYLPLSIEITDSKKESHLVQVFGETPLNKHIQISFDVISNKWWRNDNIFLKKIFIVVPDSIQKKITKIVVNNNETIKTVKFDNLELVGKENNCGIYTLPNSVHNKMNVLRIILLIIEWDSFIRIAKLFLILIIGILIWLIIKYLYNNTFLKSATQVFCTFNTSKTNNDKYKMAYKTIYSWIKTFVIALFVACYLFFGYLLLIYGISSFITTILFIVFWALFLKFIIKIIVRIFKIKIPFKIIFKRIYFLFFILWFCVEVVLFSIGVNKTYNERIGFFYKSGFNEALDDEKRNDFVWTHKRNEKNNYNRKEFDYEYRCNSEGLRDNEHTVEKPDSTYRIICLGNSYTEGVGAPQDSTWPALLQNKINTITDNITVFNAGCSGSDPFFEYFLLKKRLLKYKPDIVLLTMGATDIHFYINRGGDERFTKEGLKFRDTPKWEMLYAMSFVVRYFTDNILHYKNFLSPKEYINEIENAQIDIYNCIQKFYKLSVDNSFKLIAVFYDDGNNYFKMLISKLRKENIIPVIDLSDYNKNIENIPFDDIYKNYMWPIDKHFNSKGYDLMARGVFWNLRNLNIFENMKHKRNN